MWHNHVQCNSITFIVAKLSFNMIQFTLALSSLFLNHWMQHNTIQPKMAQLLLFLFFCQNHAVPSQLSNSCFHLWQSFTCSSQCSCHNSSSGLLYSHRQIKNLLSHSYCCTIINKECSQAETKVILAWDVALQLDRLSTGLHNSFHPTIRDGSTWSKFGARGEHGDVFLFSNLGAL